MRLVDFCCPVCTSEEFEILYPNTIGDRLPRFDYNFSYEHTLTYRIVRCKKCRHAYSSPRPENLYLYYRDVVDLEYLKNQVQRIKNFEIIVEKLTNFITSGRLLDVGCSTGDFLSVAQNHFAAEGLELSSWASKHAANRGFTIHTCTLEDLKANQPYNLVTLWGVIEHFEYPRNEVRHINRILEMGGFVSLWTGDIDSILSFLLRRKWWYIQGQHIQFFSLSSLDRLFQNSGFERIFLEDYPYIMTASSIAMSLRRYPWLGKIPGKILNIPWLADKTFTIKLPGELFAIYKKTKEL